MSVTRLVLNYLMNIDLHPVFGDKYIMWYRSYIGITMELKNRTSSATWIRSIQSFLSGRMYYFFLIRHALYILSANYLHNYIDQIRLSYLYGKILNNNICISSVVY